MGLVSTEWLAARLSDPAVRVCDVRWYLPGSGRRGADEYAAGHIPGAVFVDLDHDLAARDDGRAGRHPLPDPTAFQTAMRRAGIGARTHVVAYDDAGGSVAARLWWLLRASGHAQVSLLDGGITTWKAEGRPLERDLPKVPPGDFVSRWNAESAIGLEDLRDALRGGAVLLDARARERYRGDTEPVDPRPGHIPGSVSAPFSENLAAGRFLPADALKKRYAALLPAQGEVIASCGSGVTACHDLFALDLAGVLPFPRARLFPGSYSEWSRRRDLPVALGDDPGEPA
jgi:thiosulfate/3-mercaptopyruvate sulfurtransferase